MIRSLADSHRPRPKEFAIATATVRRDQILVDPSFNPRTSMDEEQLAELAASIAERGLLQPPRVRLVPDADPGQPPRYMLVAGHRRIEALDRLAADRPDLLEGIDVVLEDVVEAADTFVDAIVENIQRENLSVIDEARAYQRLRKDGGLTIEGVAKKCGVAKKRVTERLELLKFPADVVALLQDGTLPPSARSTLKKLAEVSPDLCSAVAVRAAQEGVAAGKLLTKQEHHRVIEVLADTKGEPFYRLSGQWDAQRVRDLGTSNCKDLATRIAKLTPRSTAAT